MLMLILFTNAESKEWKSQLTVESVMEMAEVKALLREKDVRTLARTIVHPQDANKKIIYCNIR